MKADVFYETKLFWCNYGIIIRYFLMANSDTPQPCPVKTPTSTSLSDTQGVETSGD